MRLRAMLRVCMVLAPIVLFAFQVRGEDAPGADGGTKGEQAQRDEVSELLNKGFASFQDHRNDEAITAYTQAIRLDPKNARAFALRAWAFSRGRDKIHALEDAEKAVALDPQLALAHKALGYAYIANGEADRGIAESNIAISLDPGLASAYSDRGVGHYTKKDYDLAMADFNKAIEIDPKLAFVYSNRGMVHVTKKEYDQAISDCAKAVELDPKLAVAYLNRGNAYSALQDHDRANADYTKAIELDPKLPPAKSGSWNAEDNSKFIDYAANAFSAQLEGAFKKAEALREQAKSERQSAEVRQAGRKTQTTEFRNAVIRALAATMPSGNGRKGATAVVSFVVSEKGKLQDLKLLRSSGDRWLDREALSAIRLAHLPLPAPGLSLKDRALRVEFVSK